MDDALGRRLIGAAVLLAGAWGLAALLPAPEPQFGRSASHVVTYDLRTGQPLEMPPVAREAPRSPTQPAPVELAAESEPEPAPKLAPPAAVPAPLPHPVLKVDESLGDTPTGAWYVQIGSFSNQANARGVLQKLYGAELPVLIQTVPTGKQLWYRVRVGPYAAENAAQKALGTVKKKGFTSARLVRPDTGPATGRN